MITIISSVISVIGTALGAWKDQKTGIIPPAITYSMIGIGIVLSVITFAMTGIWFNLLAAPIVFGILYVAYKMGQVGGGDVKMITGITLLNPTNAMMFLFIIGLVACGATLSWYYIYNFVVSKKHPEWKDKVKFGPFILLGLIIALVYTFFLI